MKIDKSECNPEAIRAHLNRIEGQIRAVSKMYEEKRDIEEIVRLVHAARASLDSVSQQLIAEKVSGCYDKQAVIKKEELLKLINTLFKTT